MTALLTAPQGTDDADYSARVNGRHYVSYIETLHQTLTPCTYLEVGTLSGGTLKVAKCASIAIDPKFHITTDVLRIVSSEDSDTLAKLKVKHQL